MGLVLGLTGAGGGILAVPALVLGLGLTMTQAAPVALFAVGSAAAIGAIDGLRHGLVRYRAALLIALLGAVFFAGRYLFRPSVAGKDPDGPVQSADGHGGLADVAPGKARRWSERSRACQLGPEELHARSADRAFFSWTAKCTATLAALGAVTGVVSGLLGVGGGFLIVPAFKQLTDVQMRGIVATSLMVISLISVIGVIGAFHAGVRIDALGVSFIVASIVGMILGRKLCARVPARGLQIGFASVCVVIAVYMLFRALV